MFARVFGTPDGLEVLALLRHSVDNVTMTGGDPGALRVMEGKRQLLRAIESRVAHGRHQHITALRRDYPALGTDSADPSGG